LFASLYVNILTATYANIHASYAVTDIILSNIPVFNVDDLFVIFPIIFWTILSVYAVLNPRKIPFWLKTTALFVVVRSVFMTLTHVGPFPDRVSLEEFNYFPSINFHIFNSGADLFFSGHTGLPFLNALIFWNNPRLRVFCILSAIFFGIVVLLGHLHYSIDVLSAFFITYTIYHIALKVFPTDRERFFS
jgi:hypothetical protein